MTKEQEDTWLAGLLDGEGSLSMRMNDRGVIQVCLSISQIHCDALLFRIKEVVGAGQIYPASKWVINSKEDILSFLDRTEKYLIVKSREATLIRAFCNTMNASGYNLDLKTKVLRYKLLDIWEAGGRKVGR